jgi:hypothetical protein
LSLIAPWVLFPAVLVAIGAGWGAVVERAAGGRASGALMVPIGLAAAIVASSLLTAWSVTARAATPVLAVGAVAGLAAARPWRRFAPWPALAAGGALLAYGAPVILSGSATFTGYVRLDDTATWLGISDHVLSHGRSLADLPPSSYLLVMTRYIANNYPLGSFMLLGAGHRLTGVDAAWIFQPYLACCGAAVALGLYAIVEPLLRSPRVSALVAFFGAQPALLYGYALWGGIKELTAAFLLVLGAALIARAIGKRPPRARELLPLAIAAAALMVTLGPGSAAWVVPGLIVLLLAWLVRARRGELPAIARSLIALAVVTAALAVPMWVVLSGYLGNDSNLYATTNSPRSETLANLDQPLSGWQLAGIWPVGDFRVRAPTIATALLIGLALIAAVAAIALSLRRGRYAVPAYLGVALAGCAVYYLAHTTPWVLGKALAIASPAVPTAALAGAALLLARRRAGLVVMFALCAGIAWSNALAYHDATLAPRARLLELQHIGGLVAGKGPTLVNEYEIYAARHFLREGAPVEPAEERPVAMPLRRGTFLFKFAWADLDSFPLSDLLPYRSIVTRRSPAESRPPSLYRLVWQGRYYQLWQRPARTASEIRAHVPLGQSNALPYCGNALSGVAEPLCSVDPVAVPACALLQRLGRRALQEHAQLVAYQRPEPIVARGDDTTWPVGWLHQPESHDLIARDPGRVTARIVVARADRYGLWLEGNFARGFNVTVDGRDSARVKDQLSEFGGYVHTADMYLTAGVHTVVLTYPHPDLTPGSGDTELTSLVAIALEPSSPASELITVPAREASRLCGRPLDWIELVSAPA